MDLRSSDNRTPPDLMADARFHRALTELLKGSDYADITSGNVWDYAVEMRVLKGFGLSDNDLRLLVQKLFLEHAREITTERTHGRSFKPASDLAFAKRTCFVLTPLGVAKARSRSYQSTQPETGQPPNLSALSEFCVPTWDAARRLLLYGGQPVKQYNRPAVNQELVLSAFEEEGWPSRILDPLAPHRDQAIKQRLGETIKSLNRGQSHPLIQFHGDGTGEGILWTPAVEMCSLHIPRLRVQ
jgi:hypothetical protein